MTEEITDYPSEENLDLSEKREDSELFFEEEKNFPLYIQERMDALCAISKMDLLKLYQILQDSPDLANPQLLMLLKEKHKELNKVDDSQLKLLSEIIEKVTSLSNDSDHETVVNIALSLPMVGKTQLAINMLEKIKDDPDPETRRKVASALGQIGEPALETLRRMKNDPYLWVRGDVALVLGKIGKPTLDILEQMKKDPESDVLCDVASALHMIGETQSAIFLLKQIKNQPNPDMLQRITLTLTNIKLQSAMSDDATRKKMIHSLIFRQEPFLANPFLMEIYSSLSDKKDIDNKTGESPVFKLGEIISSLLREYPQLIGLSVLGSLSKGYWDPSSDIDWGLIYEGNNYYTNEQMIKKFTQECLSQGFKLCSNNSINSFLIWIQSNHINLKLLSTVCS